jgi:hypothetical protein
MAVRLNRNHSELCIARIRTSQLINRLQNHALKDQPLTPSQVDSAKFLIERTLARAPTRTDVNLSGNMTVSWPLPKTELDV